MMYRQFIDDGYPVFALYPIIHKGNSIFCGCGNAKCTAIGKHPCISNWQHTPLWSDEQLETMEAAGKFESGYGVLVRGLLVIDIDARNGGLESAQKIAQFLAQCAFIVETGSGNGSKHYYFSVDNNLALRQTLVEFPGIDFKSSGYVVGPGSLHKSGARYCVLVGSPDTIEPAPPGLIDLLRKSDRYRAEVDGAAVDVSEIDLAEMLSFINPDVDYDTWVKIGMAIHDTLGGSEAGFQLWHDWSARGQKYPGAALLDAKWHSFGRYANPVKLGTLIYFAEQAGWVRSVVFESTTEFTVDIDPFDFSFSDVDLLRPPGFVGELCQWINDQCRFRREHLAVAAALVAIGNIGGLRYIGSQDETANLFAFCVADSATGKEAIHQAIQEIHMVAGLSRVTHGSIKSSQEITRNLIDDQAALYIIDEIGIFLKKLTNSHKSGASYLEAVIGDLMRIYSCANGWMLVTGDDKKKLRNELLLDLKKCDSDDEEQPLKRALIEIEHGIKAPFLSLIGFTTPINFDEICTLEQAQAGFMGRSILVRELDCNPQPKLNFTKRPMPDAMKATIQGLASGGHYSLKTERIQTHGERTVIPVTEEAQKFMRLFSDWLFQQFAEQQREHDSRLVPIIRRGYELFSKIALNCSLPAGICTLADVRYAGTWIKNELGGKMSQVAATEPKTQSGAVARVLCCLALDHEESTGVIVNKCRPVKKEDVLKILLQLEVEGRIKKITSLHKFDKKQIEKWILC